MKSCTIEEVIIARISQGFEGERVAMGATILSDLGARLAKATHAPDLILAGGTSLTAWDVPVSEKALDDERATGPLGLSTMDWLQNFDAVAQDKLNIWVGPVQVDRSGASNISMLGDWNAPKIQLVGARGIPDDLWGLSEINFHVVKHSHRTLVDTVDFVCGVGFGTRRDELGLTTGWPGTLVSDLGVFHWDRATGTPYVESLHPGISMDEVQARTGWTWEQDGDIVETALPSEEQLRLIRQVIDPRGIRRLESSEASAELLSELVKAEAGTQ